MARKKLPAKQRRSKALRMPVTQAEEKKLQRAAEREGMPFATWARFVLLRAAEKSLER